MAKFEIPEWGEEPDSWNVLGNGAPGVALVGRAIQVWAVLQNRECVTVAEAASALNIDPQRVVEAVEEHCWMFLEGPRDDFAKLTIEHEGE